MTGEHNPLEVVVMGAAGIDTSIFLPGQEIDFSVEANFSENIDYVGGAGGYSTRGFAQLGRKTSYIGYNGFKDRLIKIILSKSARR